MDTYLRIPLVVDKPLKGAKPCRHAVRGIAKGEALVKTGGACGAGHTMACAPCHGADLKGVGPIPGIAGRSPSYIVRQLYDIQQGTRAGAMSVLMKPTVEKLTGDDMNAIATYLATQLP